MAKKLASIAELKKLLAQREEELAGLTATRKKLADRLTKVDGRIAELGGQRVTRRRPRATGKARRGRPPQKTRGKKTLKQAVAEVLGATRKALGPKEIAEALPAVGHASKSKNLSVMVGQVLSGNRAFRRVARGKYRLRPRGAGK